MWQREMILSGVYFEGKYFAYELDVGYGERKKSGMSAWFVFVLFLV